MRRKSILTSFIKHKSLGNSVRHVKVNFLAYLKIRPLKRSCTHTLKLFKFNLEMHYFYCLLKTIKILPSFLVKKVFITCIKKTTFL